MQVKQDDALVIEDSFYGNKTAKKAGIKVLALKDDKFDLDQSQADIIIDDLIEVIGHLEWMCSNPFNNSKIKSYDYYNIEKNYIKAKDLTPGQKHLVKLLLP